MFMKIEPIRSKGETYRMQYYGNNITIQDFSRGTPCLHYPTQAAKEAILKDLESQGYEVIRMDICTGHMISVRVERKNDGTTD